MYEYTCTILSKYARRVSFQKLKYHCKKPNQTKLLETVRVEYRVLCSTIEYFKTYPFAART